ncbi:hypothetical protein APHAL10511_000541 [Amanita phalloides]|nr:hypothetical protein APHAL10511_000541 [Amanita phalloides]
MGYRTSLAIPFLLLASSLVTCVTAVYRPVREYKGSTFFDKWYFAGKIDDSTFGNVYYLDRAQATSKRLAYINSAGNAIMKVDDKTYIPPTSPNQVHRGSIRITSKDTYDAGSLIVLDVRHIPWGCSLWPAFWTIGSGTWPNGGEIDIIEAINLMGFNQYAVHTGPGCTIDTRHSHTGRVTGINCATPSGCVVEETKPNSYAAGFAQAGGGVYATKLDVSGIYIWFWSRPNIPNNIKTATAKSTLDSSSWGPPSLAIPSTTCNYTKFFTAQQLVFTTTLCGGWAGNPGIYNLTCHTRTGSCVNDNVVGSGSNYDNAYWEVSYIRTYAAAGSPADIPTSD